MDILIPRFASPQRPNGIIPPSPPAETRQRNWREIERQLLSYRGRMPHVIAPGYIEPGGPRVIAPGMPEYQDAVRQMCMPSAIKAHRRSLKPQPTSGIPALHDAKFAYQFGVAASVDSSGNNAALTTHGSPSAGAGNIGNTLTTGSGNWADVDNTSTVLNFTGTNMTAAGWFFWTANVTGFDCVFGFGTANATNGIQWQFQVPSGGAWTYRYNQSSGGVFRSVSTGSAVTGAWHLVILRINTGNTNQEAGISIDNGAFATGQSTGGLSSLATGHLIFGGCYNSGSQALAFNGKVGPCWGWTRDIGSTGYSSLWNSGNGALVY